MRHTFRLPVLMACLALAPHTATAETGAGLQPYNGTGYYTVSWGGITVGGMVVDAHEDADSYRMQVETRSSGLVKAISKHHSSNTVSGLRRSGEYIPQRFESRFSLRGKSRHIVLEYDKQGRLTHEENNPPEPEHKRPPVPMDVKRDVIDALTTLFVQRQKIHEALASGQDRFTIRMYDGRRVTDLEYYVRGRRGMGWNMQEVPIIEFAFSRIPVAGYKDSELKDLAGKTAPNVSLYLSDDGRLIPLKIVVDSSAGEFYANLSKDCETLQACLTLF